MNSFRAAVPLVLLLTAACVQKESSNAHPAKPAAVPVAPVAKPRPLADTAYRAELSLAKPAAATAAAGSKVRFVVRIRNRGTGIFPAKPSGDGLRDAVFLSYHILSQGSKDALVFNGSRAAFPSDLQAGTAVELPIEVIMPDAPGKYVIHFDLVQEDVAWFESRQNPVLAITVTVV